jgi:spore germination cell wall hydrolase CwlJ-like protein
MESERILTGGEGVRGWPLTLIGILVIALMCAAAWVYRGQFPAHDHASSTSVALGPAPPPVEPMIYQQVSEDVAKAKNAETPFTTKPVPPAAPFRFAGGGLDLARAIDCMASAIYYEAGAETLAGQKAVAQVILNRVRSPAYPTTICGVVFQGSERRTGCQFSYTCDGSIIRRKPSESYWTNLRALARQMIGGEVYAPVGWATHYHTNWVLPVWSARLDKVRQEGTHLFFRWNGYWGTPGAFRGSGGAGEPAQARMVALSPFHRTPETLAEAQTLATLMASLGTGTATGDAVFADPDGGQFILAIDPGTDPSMLVGLAERTCGDRAYCKVMAWSKGAAMPSRLPVDDAQFGAMAFSYLRNRANEFEKPLWNCAVFPRDDKRQCIRKRVVIEGKAQELIPMAPDPGPPPRDSVASGAPLDKNGLRPMNPDEGAGSGLKPPPVARTAERRIPGRGE